MALLSDAAQLRISSYFVRPSRSTAVANAANGLVSAVGAIDFTLGDDVNHRANIYTLSKPPTPALVPNAKIGDIAIVYIVDDAAAANPTGCAIFVYNTTVNAAGTVSGTPSWRMLTMSA